MAKAKARKRRKVPPEKVRYTLYQIQVKGPEEFKGAHELFAKIKQRLTKGDPLLKEDRYKNVMRSIGGEWRSDLDAVELQIVNYNSVRTGLSWDTSKDQLVKELNTISAQQTLLIVFIEKHIAIHLYKPRGPGPSQVVSYLQGIFEEAASEFKSREYTIEVLPAKLGGVVDEIRTWKTLKRLTIEVIRPNPEGRIKATQLRELLEKGKADKAVMELGTRVKEGMNKTVLTPLIAEVGKLAEVGQGRIEASGLNADNVKEEIDTKKSKVRYFQSFFDPTEQVDKVKKLYDEALTWLNKTWS